MLKIWIILTAVFASEVLTTPVKKCKLDKELPFPLSVEVEGCDKPPCKIVKGTKISMHIKFTNGKNVTSNVVAKVRAHVMNLPVNYDLPPDVADVCSNLENGDKCPIPAGQEVVYNFQFLVAKYYPEISANIEVSLVDENKNVLTCFMCPIKVKKRMNSKYLELE